MRPSAASHAFAPLFARFPISAQRLGQHAGTLSGGEKKILSFVRGLAEAEPLLLLDEPSEGVQWENVVHMAELIGAAKAAGTSFVVVEQNLAFAELIADRYLVIEQGGSSSTGAAPASNARSAACNTCTSERRTLPARAGRRARAAAPPSRSRTSPGSLGS
jgi:branched-chain amino acid transport system ATP-binding protein